MTGAAVRIHEVPDDSVLEYCFEQGWTDGLPVVPPTVERVEEMLASAGRERDEVVASHPPTGRRCTVFLAAVNATMAGCLPAYFPVVLAALEAMDRDPYNFHASTASTGGCAPLLIVSGPVTAEIAMNPGVNVFGPGNRANATIGRAIRLIIMNVFRMLPGITDLSTQGNPGKYSFCIAENQAANPWEPLHVELGFNPEDSTVTVFAAGGFHNVENHASGEPRGILLSIADSMAGLGIITNGQTVVVMTPEHARIVAGDGWSKEDVRGFLYEHARRLVADLRAVGKGSGSAGDGEFVHRGTGPQDILITVAGGDAGGHSAFIPSWSRGRTSIMQTHLIRPLEARHDDHPL